LAGNAHVVELVRTLGKNKDIEAPSNEIDGLLSPANAINLDVNTHPPQSVESSSGNLDVRANSGPLTGLLNGTSPAQSLTGIDIHRHDSIRIMTARVLEDLNSSTLANVNNWKTRAKKRLSVDTSNTNVVLYSGGKLMSYQYVGCSIRLKAVVLAN
jgi:hypothetical protein